MHQAAGPLLSIQDLSFRYPPRLPTGPGSGALVLDSLTLEIPSAATAVLLGRADAGKTTLARIIAGLVPRFTGGGIAGSVKVQGRDIRPALPYDLVETIGLVAQDSEEQLITTRCDAEAAFALESLGFPRPEMRTRVHESLEKVGLGGLAHRNPATLSGGEKKRLLVACLLAVRPALWILDEALGELDFEWKTRILDLASEASATVLLMESRWSPLAESRGTSFFLVDAGRVRAAAAGARDESLAAALRSAGVLPADRSAPAPVPVDGCLRAAGLRFRFPGDTGFGLLVEHLELRFGEICALVGRNGSGKSTLARILCGLLRPQEGNVGFGGPGGDRPARAEELCARVGYLFQNPDHQLFLPTVREELALGLRALRLGSRETDNRISEAAARFDLPDLDAPPALLSYGARRRLQAATYFLLSRDLLILDEIDSGLSYREIETLLDALASRVPGLVLITHDLALARSACRRILVMEQGRIAVDSPSEGFDPAGEWTAQAVAR
jgi:energy-coupling factor transporter ATP-binding protein EcfA2